MGGGIESTAWLAIAQDGNWIVKVFGLQEGSLKYIKDEANIYEYLRKYNINVPETKKSIQNKSVEGFKYHSNIYSMMVMKFEKLKECRPSTIKRNDFSKIVKDIAKMHNVLKKYPGIDKCIGKSPSDSKWPEVFITGFYPNLIKSPNSKVFNKKELNNLESLNQKFIEYVKSKSMPSNLAHSIIHGDLSLEHAQVLPDGNIYFFDFADRKYAPVAEELGVFLSHLFRAGDISFERWEELKTWLLEDYVSVAKLTKDDREAVQVSLLYRLVYATNWLNEKSIETGRDVDGKGNKRRLKLADYLLSV